RAAGDRRRRRPARGAPASPLSACAGATGTPVVLAAMPAIMVVAAARWMSPTVFVYRYFLCLAPAIAVIMAWTIRGVRSSRIRLVLVTIVAGLSVLGMGVGVERMEDWRMALHAAADATNGKPVPVLVGATFIESARLRWPLDPEEAGYLVAPVAFYRVPGPGDSTAVRPGRRGHQLPPASLDEAGQGTRVLRSRGQHTRLLSRAVCSVSGFARPYARTHGSFVSSDRTPRYGIGRDLRKYQ